MAMSLNEVISSLWSNIKTYLGNNYLSKNGKAASATVADKATADASGNTITSTYATKVENSTKANSSDLTSHTTNNDIHVTSSDKTNWNNKSNFSGSYTDLTNKPTIPIVNNATLTIQKNGTTVKSFTANSSSNVTANITVPTKVSELTNDSGYITGVSWDNVSGKPSTFTPSSHTHDDRYYTEGEIDTKLGIKANDSSVVHISGDEIISGIKYFDSTNNSISLVKRITDYATETTPTSNVYQHLAFQDKNNKNIALVQYSSRTSNVRDLDLYVLDGSGGIYGLQINTNKEVVPSTNNEYSLGSSSNSWLSVYASNFYGYSGSFSYKVEAPLVRANADLGLILANKDSNAPTTTSGWNQVNFYDKNIVSLGYFQLYSDANANVYNWVGKKNSDSTIRRIIRWNVDADIFCCSSDNTISLGGSSNRWSSVYATTVNTSILNIPQNAIVLAFCSSEVSNGSTVAGTSLKVASGGTGGTFTATTETLTGTYRALNTVVANGVGMFVKIV